MKNFIKGIIHVYKKLEEEKQAMKENISRFKKFEIKWLQGGLNFEHIEEKLTITLDKVSFERKTSNHVCADFDYDVKWDYKIIDVKFVDNFIKLCELFLNTKDKTILVSGCDVSIFSIEITTNNGKKIIENYCCNMMDNGFDEVIILLEEFIPQVASRPYFFGEQYVNGVV